jgi:cytidylate kinase
MSKKTIIEAYAEKNKGLIIVISGLSGSGKTKLGKEIATLFKCEFLNTAKFCKKDYDNKISFKLPSSDKTYEFTNWDSDDIIDWDKLNNEVKDIKTKGVIISGISFPKDKITFKPDFHIHIKLNKQNLIKKRQEFVEDHEEDCKEFNTIKDYDVELYLINHYTYPYYLTITQNSIINKFINANEFSELNKEEYFEKIFNESIDYLLKMIGDKLIKDHGGKII